MEQTIEIIKSSIRDGFTYMLECKGDERSITEPYLELIMFRVMGKIDILEIIDPIISEEVYNLANDIYLQVKESLI